MNRLRSRGPARLPFVLAGLLALASPPAARAQDAAPAAHERAPDGKKVLTLADYPSWKRINAAAISNDGRWVTYTYAPNEGDDTLFVQQVDGDKRYTVPVGSAAGGRARRPRRIRRWGERPVLRQFAVDRLFREPAGQRGARPRAWGGWCPRRARRGWGWGWGRRRSGKGRGGGTAAALRTPRPRLGHQVRRAGRQRLPVRERLPVSRHQDVRHTRRHVAPGQRPDRASSGRRGEPEHRQRDAVRFRRRRRSARLHRGCGRPPRQRRLRGQHRHRRHPCARQQAHGVRRAGLARLVHQPRGAARGEAQGQGTTGEHAAGLDRRRVRPAGHDLGSIGRSGLPQRLRAQRVLGAAVEQGRRAPVHRHQGTAGHAAEVHRGVRQRRRLAPRRCGVAVAADDPDQSAAPGDVLGGADRGVAQLRRPLRQRRHVGHSGRRRRLGRGARSDAVRARFLRGRAVAGGLLPDQHGHRRPHAHRQAPVAYHGHLARRPVVSLSGEPARDGLRPRRRQVGERRCRHRQELHRHRRRPCGGEADLGRGRVDEGRPVGAAVRQVRSLAASARRVEGAESDRRCRRGAAGAAAAGAAWPAAADGADAAASAPGRPNRWICPSRRP